MKAIVLLNMGGARNEKELKEFLFNMFMDKRIINSPIRYILAPLISNLRYKKVWKNYELIGGSRIYTLTEKLIEKMKKYTDFEIEYAMRYTKPKLKDIAKKYDELILLPLYPHFSLTTIQSSLDEAKDLNSVIVKEFYNNKKFNQIIAQKIQESVTNPKEWNLIFSAHGLPLKIAKKDPYYQQIQKQIEILKEMLNFKSIHLAFQSRFGFSKWLEPYLEDKLKEFKNKKVLIYPISFMIDNSETDLELKIEYKKIAKELGVKEYKVVECPNDDDKIAKFLVELAHESYNSKSK